ncbi:MAG TPA: hypothetical protein VN634_05290 [Candidatus Limnocylindrales bacterium]|nr:hypothetical protein [Candidatus Limnocylindrales bacterium]
MRLSLFEFEDQPWCPPVLRNAITGYLRIVVAMTRQVRPVVPALVELLRRSGETSILDLCSGSGSIACEVGQSLALRGAPAPITLSDLFPDEARLERLASELPGVLRVHPAPLDATRVPPAMPGLRTMFNAFHHFDPPAAREILRDAATAGRPIAIVEFVERTPLTLLGVLVTPLLMLVVAPWLRPLRWQALLLTYVIPIVPLVVFWDGLVSWLRVYSVRELGALASEVVVPGYSWSAGRWRVGPVRVTYLLGYPA